MLILDGKRVTTHWRYAEKLAARYPALEVDPNVLYIDAGQILTSAGSAAGIDLCLHLVRRDFGPVIANQVARRLVVQPHRNGGQAQFIERPIPPRPDSRFAALFDSMRARLSERLTIASLARMAAMSQRTFLRRFRESTGTTPAEWLISTRVDRARERLEASNASLESLATECGFGSAATMRHHFRRKLGMSPSAYQQRFSQPTP